MSGSGRESIPDVQEWSWSTLVCPRVVGRPIRMSGRSRESLQDDRKWSRGPVDVWEW